jgi:imidazolonepropionase-like amidohydrolase
MRIRLQNAHLLDGTSNRNSALADILVNGTIEAIRPTSELPMNPDVSKIDLRGLTILPGLINAHEHLATKPRLEPCDIVSVLKEPVVTYALRAAKNATTLLRRGITTIRECGSREHVNIHLRNAISEGLLRGPHILACGSPIAIKGGHMYQYAREVRNPSEIPQAVREQVSAGADFIKVHASGGAGDQHGDPTQAEFTVEELAAIVEEAKKEKRRVAAHVIGRTAVQNALDAGVSTIEHGHYLDSKQADFMAAKEMIYVPTMSGYQSAFIPDASRHRPQWSIDKAKRIAEGLQQAVRAAISAGVLIAAGTDSFGDIVDELILLRQAGLSAYTTLAAVTSTAALALGIEAQAGALKEGMQADLIAVAGNPLDNLEALRNPVSVMKGGEIVFGPKLSDSL